MYVTNLPRDIFEDQLMPLFSTCGPVFKLRLMMCFSGHNRGFCFVLFFTQEARDMCIQRFRQFPLCNRLIFAHISSNKRLLVMGNVDLNLITTEDIQFFCQQNTKALKAEFIIDPVYGRPQFFIYYRTHYDAAMARRMFLSHLHNFGSGCYVRWVNQR